MTKVAQKSISYHVQDKAAASLPSEWSRNLHCSHQGFGDHRKKKHQTRKQTQI